MSLEKYSIRTQTTTSGTTTAFTWVMPDNCSVDAILRIQARNTSNNNTSTFKREYELTKSTGDLSVSILNDISDVLNPFSTVDVSLDNNSGTLEVNITGESGTTLQWRGTLTLQINR